MCYNNCRYFEFNPMTGTDRCTRGRNPCPDSAYECSECGLTMEEHFEECPECGEETN